MRWAVSSGELVQATFHNVDVTVGRSRRAALGFVVFSLFRFGQQKTPKSSCLGVAGLIAQPTSGSPLWTSKQDDPGNLFQTASSSGRNASRPDLRPSHRPVVEQHSDDLQVSKPRRKVQGRLSPQRRGIRGVMSLRGVGRPRALLQQELHHLDGTSGEHWSVGTGRHGCFGFGKSSELRRGIESVAPNLIDLEVCQ